MKIRILRACVLALSIGMAMVLPCWSIELGQSMPEFTMRALDGSTASSTTLKGKPVLLVFWNTWCPNCMKELPEIERLTEKFGPGGLAVIAVNTAMNDNESKARAYWEKYEYKFPTGFDRYFEIGQAFAVFAVPTVFLFDSNGVAVYKQARLPDDIEERIEQLISRK